MIGGSIEHAAGQHGAELSTVRPAQPARHYVTDLPIMKSVSVMPPWLVRSPQVNIGRLT